MDRFWIYLDIAEEGLYKVKVVFKYTYHGKKRTVETDEQTFIYTNRNITELDEDYISKLTGREAVLVQYDII